MTCAHSLLGVDTETAFAIDASRIVFGAGVLGEIGEHVRGLGCKRVALFTDRRVAQLELVALARKSLQNARIDAVLFDAVHVEPTDESFMLAARFARDGRFDGYVSVGGGSTIDTCKAAALYATHPTGDFLDYVNRPIGAGNPVPGALPPHVACPTTCGTGSETTGIAVCDVLALKAKTGIASRHLRPTLALVDPTCTYSLPREVVAASGFDVLCHALESFTARPFDARARASTPHERPMSQGANRWSDIGSREALALAGKHLVRAVNDASDHEARDALAWAATLAGIAFGNAGVHIPHAMSYAVAGLVRDFRMPGYPHEEALVPHGVSVIVNAVSAFRFTAEQSPARHVEAAKLLGGESLEKVLDELITRTGMPRDLTALGYDASDIPALVRGAFAQQRLLTNAPRDVSESDLATLFSRGFS